MTRLLVAAAVLAAVVTTPEAEAAISPYRSGYRSGATVSRTPTYAYGSPRYRPGRRQGAFARMMELERQKNAALRRMFFGY
jgi:hypothetical protein